MRDSLCERFSSHPIGRIRHACGSSHVEERRWFTQAFLDLVCVLKPKQKKTGLTSILACDRVTFPCRQGVHWTNPVLIPHTTATCNTKCHVVPHMWSRDGGSGKQFLIWCVSPNGCFFFIFFSFYFCNVMVIFFFFLFLFMYTFSFFLRGCQILKWSGICPLTGGGSPKKTSQK